MLAPQQARGLDPMLFQYWPIAYGAGPALKPHCAKSSCLLGRCLRRWLVIFTLTEIYVVLILAHRLRLRPNIKTITVQHLLFVGSIAVCTSVCYVIEPHQSYIVQVIHCTLWCTYMLTLIELKRKHGVSWWIFLFNPSSPPAALSANDAMLLNIALGRWRLASNRSLFKAMKGWGAVSHLVLFI